MNPWSARRVCAPLVAILALTGCTVIPVTHHETAKAPTPSGIVTSEPVRSKPLGSWELKPGAPQNTPADLPVPEGRWLESSTPFDSDGGMVDLWVNPHEMETLRDRLKSEGWKFSEPDHRKDPDRVIYTAYKDKRTRSLYFGYTYASETWDAKLTLTYTKYPT